MEGSNPTIPEIREWDSGHRFVSLDCCDAQGVQWRPDFGLAVLLEERASTITMERPETLPASTSQNAEPTEDGCPRL